MKKIYITAVSISCIHISIFRKSKTKRFTTFSETRKKKELGFILKLNKSICHRKHCHCTLGSLLIEISTKCVSFLRMSFWKRKSTLCGCSHICGTLKSQPAANVIDLIYSHKCVQMQRINDKRSDIYYQRFPCFV